MRRKAPEHRSTQSPSRTVVQVGRGQRPPEPASRPRRAMPQAPLNGGRSAQNHLRPGPGQGSKAADLSAPPIPLTLPAMHPSPHPRARSLSRSPFALFSVLALLAFACFPAFAQAETVYETESPAIPGETVSPEHKNHQSPESSKDAEVSGTPSPGGGSEGPGTGSGEKGGTKDHNPSTPNGGGSGQGSPGNASGEKKQGGDVLNAKPVSSTTESGGSSSPLVPILIAVAVLAAITIGAVVLRQRRQRGEPGGQVSPRAS